MKPLIAGNRILLIFSAVMCLCLLAGLSAADTDNDGNVPALQNLLKRAQELRSEDRQTNRMREQQFLQARDRQRELLEAAEQENIRLQQESERLENKFQSNEVELQSLDTVYHQHAGSVVELSGIMRQFSGRLHAQLSDTFISLHIDGWQEKLDSLKSSKGLPTVAEIEVLWDLFLQYMLIQSKNLRFESDITYADGNSMRHEVVTVGPFTAIAKGRFLNYLPENQRFVMLERQPGSRYLKAARTFAEREEVVVAAPIDPSRGALLSLLIRTPTLIERIEQGGLVAYLILAIGMIGLLLGAERIITLGRIARSVRLQAKDPAKIRDNPLGRIFSTYQAHIKSGLETLELKLDKAIISEIPRLDRGIAALKVFAVIAPLLGLLGTVTGMIETFQAITLFGTGDPKLMSGGISQALVTTALGLTVAIPIILLHVYISTRSRHIKEILEEQSAGLMAEYAYSTDKQHG